MYLLYSILLAVGFLIMSPLFLLRREKYASGFSQRLGDYPPFVHDGRSVIWLHCVSVGEMNAARPLVDEIKKGFPNHRLVVSTTTKTGQDLAKKVFAGKADAVVYFPFDFKFSVRRALDKFKPSLVLLMETEIWPRFIREAKKSGSKIAIVNGRISRRSYERYSVVGSFIAHVLSGIDLALMQGLADADRVMKLGLNPQKVRQTGNLKFDHDIDQEGSGTATALSQRFHIDGSRPLIVAASTHEPEEKYVLEAVDGELRHSCRLLIAPRHPERFDAVENLLRKTSYTFVRRSAPPSDSDAEAEVILLDSIGELRSVYPLADIVFVGGSLVPHGGQSILEPAAAGKAIITGPYTANFDEIIKVFLENDAIRQTAVVPQDVQHSERLYEHFIDLFRNKQLRDELGRKALAVVNANQGATRKTIVELTKLAAGSSQL